MQAITYEVPMDSLLPIAQSRLQRQKQYARMLERGGSRAKGVMGWLEQASHCISSLGKASIILKPIDAKPTAQGILLDQRVYLDGEDIFRKLSTGGEVTAYLLTLGFSQQQAFDLLDQDYAAHHVQSDLASEVLFALGRAAQQVLRNLYPNNRLIRVPVQSTAICGERRTWDPRRVQELLSVFDDINPGVSLTETGCFSPLNSLLGLTLRV
ncbi:hypothetical protein O2N63_15405 [Aliiroseovarius sp. KMU-50]|uniref:Uncharacterized protein n=1 Tax=Aliiroseovarius salicola TaxID=3009082 RepID=A0ABT4W4M7_9RHOB|nr:hypothetical protein [Aliiroseovarius sp. KMU-50]MDA5095475.1 hypothetical protein [Aliiroseovarius sp. KMU-50]